MLYTISYIRDESTKNIQNTKLIWSHLQEAHFWDLFFICKFHNKIIYFKGLNLEMEEILEYWITPSNKTQRKMYKFDGSRNESPNSFKSSYYYNPFEIGLWSWAQEKCSTVQFQGISNASVHKDPFLFRRKA